MTCTFEESVLKLTPNVRIVYQEITRWERIQSVHSMTREGRSISSIARDLDISLNTVYSDLKISSRPSHHRSSPYDSISSTHQRIGFEGTVS